MRLLNTTTLTLTEHPESRLPEYAILSHRWLDPSQEVTFEDLQNGRDVSKKAGFAKLKNFCSIAASKRHKYAWCDTCCIDKASAVELGSAINSMYRWYKDADICIAYLQDVCEDEVAFEDSEWFRRGWTLQELIAPSKLEFFDQGWRSLGSKNDNVGLLSSTTGIPVPVLENPLRLSKCSVAQRMSWAANRTTERLEDRAYSLLGLFGVSLEMIYGEHEKAFIRLQEKIIRDSADQSIFAWSMDANQSEDKVSGLFATSPSQFHACGDVMKGTESKAFSLTNLGLKISFKALPYDIETYLAFLDCSIESKPTNACAILLTRLHNSNQRARVSIKGISVLHRERKLVDEQVAVNMDVHIRQGPEAAPMRSHQAYGIWLREITPPHYETGRISIMSRTPSEIHDHVLLTPDTIGTAGIISIEPKKLDSRWSRVRWIKVGFDDMFNPVIMIANSRSQAINNFQFQKDFDEAEKLGPESSIRQKLFDNTWLRTGRWRDHQHLPTINNGWAKGFYILAHTRDHWPNQKYIFEALNLRIDFSLVTDARSNADDSGQKSIWAIDIVQTGNVLPERQRRLNKFEGWATAVAGFPIAFLGCGHILQDGINQIARTSRSNYEG